MANRDKLLHAINQASGPVCDDCLTRHVGLSARQQANARGTELRERGQIGRGQGTCTICAKVKLVNWRLDAQAQVEATPAIAEVVAEHPVSGERPWYWEGNVQARIVDYLVQAGYSIRRIADTASKEVGKDVVAVGPDGRELWVSVKGFPTPKGSTNVQARHWFAHAIFDMVLYRGENSTVDLAIGLPDGYKTYQSLAERVHWFRRSVPLRIYWVSESGQVRIS
ncbi:MAG: hypothetical protein K0R39_1113 [Symbiobacteriaceae bacterium]|nr:hypothetical protein [Symbiobacteriaceae bacterium]